MSLSNCLCTSAVADVHDVKLSGLMFDSLIWKRGGRGARQRTPGAARICPYCEHVTLSENVGISLTLNTYKHLIRARARGVPYSNGQARTTQPKPKGTLV